MKNFICLFASLLIFCNSSEVSVQNESLSKAKPILKVAILIDGNDPAGVDLINERLYNSLLDFKTIQPIERAKLNVILKEKSLNLTGITTEQASEVSQIAGADAVFVGNFSLYKTNHIHSEVWDGAISLRLVSVDNYKVLWHADHNTDGDFVLFSSMAGIGTVVDLCVKNMLKSIENKWN